MKKIFNILAAITLTTVSAHAELPVHPDELVYVRHGYILGLNCKERGADWITYQTEPDNGKNLPRGTFHHDADVPKECQQFSTRPYGKGFDLGHLRGSNAAKNDELGMFDAFGMTNILPQNAKLNRGGWLATERLEECEHNRHTLTMFMGPVWEGGNTWFVKSHGVRTPGAFWKIMESDERIVAWVMPNASVPAADIDKYLTNVAHIETLTGIKFPISEELKTVAQASSWGDTAHCSFK